MKRVLLFFVTFLIFSACTSDVPPDDGAIHVTSITLDKTSINIKEGESTLLTATILPLNADNKTVVWSSSSEETAIVNEGTVIGMSAGSAIITAMAEDNGKKATCAVTVERNLAPSVTVGANHLSAVSVILNGKANLGSSVAADLRVGFQYSKSAGILPSNSTTIDAEDTDIKYNYSSSVTGLEPGTTYYFRSFVRQNGTDVYGETKQFKTKELMSLIQTKEATGVEASEATLNAMLDLTDVLFTDIEYGFYWGLPEEELNTRLDGGQIDGHAFSTPMTSLQHKTKYWYKAYVKLDNQAFYGEVMNFTTDVIPVESVSLDNDEYAIHTIGSSVVLQATIQPSDATDKRVSWTSSNESVATVNQYGKVTALNNGTANITATTLDGGMTASCVVAVAQWVTEVRLDKTTLSLNKGDVYKLKATITPENAVNKTLIWTSSNTKVATVDENSRITAVASGSAIITVTADDGSGKQATCSASVLSPYTAVSGDAVDLGLSVKWSSCNLGATKPEECGDFFAWGDSEPYYYNYSGSWAGGKTGYNWTNYSWCKGSSSTITKYNINRSFGIVDNKTQLEREDDAAHVSLGGAWRMPTNAECAELINNCTCTWTSNYNGTGVAGRIFTSNLAGYTDKHIFLPAAGDRGGTFLYGSGGGGCFWSSSLYSDDPSCAWYVLFSVYDVYREKNYRCHGCSVRPVSD